MTDPETTPEAELSDADWVEIQKDARPGDVLLLRHRPPERVDCLLQLIHVLDGPYDHVALVTANDRHGHVRIAHATTAAEAIRNQPLKEFTALPGFVWVRAELRRRWPDDESNLEHINDIVARADLARWPHPHYAFGDLLLAGLAASSGTPIGRRDDGSEVDPEALEVVRSHLLALCTIDLSAELVKGTAGVTCASFVAACFQGDDRLAGEFSTIGKRLEELQRKKSGGGAVAATLLAEYAIRLATKPPRELLSEVLCLDGVGGQKKPADGVITHLVIGFLRVVERLHAPRRADEPVPAGDGEIEHERKREHKHDSDRQLVRIEDLHTNDNLAFVRVVPHDSCPCTQPPQATGPRRGKFHI